jgi:flagellar biosynthetic protein FliS
MIDKEAYTLRIAQAATAQLVVITFELAIEFINHAFSVQDDPDGYRIHIEKAKNAVMQLIQGLDFESPLAQDFYDIYQYMYQLLTDAYFTLKVEPVKEALELIETLLTGWKEAAAVEAAAAPAMEEHAPQVFAGLTYQRDGLAEYVVQDEQRGYKA